MSSKVGSTIATYCFLALAGGVCLVLPESISPRNTHASPDPGPPIVHLYGTARDFLESHPDFQVTPSEGFGQYAGLVERTLGPDGLPVFSGDGRRVLTPARDAEGRPIAPHLTLRRPEGRYELLFVVRQEGRWEINELVKRFLLESWGYRVTPIGASAPPSRFRDAIETHDVVYIGDDVRPEDLANKFDYPLQMASIGIVNEERFIVGCKPGGLVPGLGLGQQTGEGASECCTEFRSTALVLVDDDHWITAGFSNGPLILFTAPQRMYGLLGTSVAPGGRILGLQLNRAGAQLLAFDRGDELAKPLGVAAGRRVLMPFGQWALDNASLTPEGQRLMRNIVDWAAGNDGNRFGDSRDRLARLDGVPCTGGITSAESFQDWFADEGPGEQSRSIGLALRRQPSGVYVFDDRLDPAFVGREGFYPIDGELLAAESTAGPNDYFTCVLKATVTYASSESQFVQVQSNADLWLFIGEKLAIDLGGVHDVTDQRIDLDRLGLRDGEQYELSLFLADRSAPDSRLRIETNMALGRPDDLFPSVDDRVAGTDDRDTTPAVD